jgi:hypothetical protein
MQLPCEEDSDFFGNENLQVYAVYSSDLKADRGSFMHGKMSVNPTCQPNCHSNDIHSCKTCIFGGVAQHLDFLIMLSICACRHASHHSLLALEFGPNFTLYGRSTLKTCFPKQQTFPWLTCSHLSLEKVGSCCGTRPSFKKVVLTLESILSLFNLLTLKPQNNENLN